MIPVDFTQIDFAHVDVPNLHPSRRVFQLPSGEYVLIELRKGQESDQFLNCALHAFLCDATGTVITCPTDGKPQGPPSYSLNLHKAGLADPSNPSSVDDEVANATTRQLQQFYCHLKAKSAWSKLPDPAPDVPLS